MRRLVLVVLSPPAALTAQIQVRAFAHTDIVATADSVVRGTTPAGTVLAMGSWSIGTQAGDSSCLATAGAFLPPPEDAEFAAFEVMARALVNRSGCSSHSVVSVDGAVRFEVSNPSGPVAGTLHLTTRSLPGTRHPSVSVDVFADGRLETQPDLLGSTWPGALRYPLVLDATPTPIVVALGGGARTTLPGMEHLEAALSFVPEEHPLARIESPCGPTLESYFLIDRYRARAAERWVLNADGLSPSGSALLVFGTRALVFPAPPTNCPLLTDVLVPLPLVVEPDGTAGLRFDVGPWARNASIRFQCTSLEMPGGVALWRTSDAFHLRLP